MRTFQRLALVAAFIMPVVFVASLPARTQGPAGGAKPAAQSSAREEAYRANNLGVALLEQFKYKEASDQFRRALQLAPALAIARINLAIALYNIPDLPGALREAKAASELLPNAPQPHYILGLIARTQNRVEDALASFQKVLQIDPRDVGASVNLSQIYLQQRKYAESIPVLRRALEEEPYSVTATYNLGIALTRGGQREEGQRMMQRFQALREAGYGTVIGQNYLEQGQYAEAISSTGAEPDLVDASTPDVSFSKAAATALPQSPSPQATGLGLAAAFRATFKASDLNESAKRELATRLAGGMTLFDYDGDGDLDIFEAGPIPQRLYRNDGGKFTDVTRDSGLAGAPPDAVGMAAVAGDYDNDTRPDLFVLRWGGSSLYKNSGNGKFVEVTAAAGVPAYPHLALSAALVDIDHDGDLDLFIAGFVDLAKVPPGDPSRALAFPDDFASAPSMLLRNNGDGKFTDITEKAQLSGVASRAVAVVPTDYDNRRDVDLVIVNFGGAPALLANQRDGTFRDRAADAGLGAKGVYTAIAAGDVNKDGFTDFFFGRRGEPGLLAMSDGRGRFDTSPAPAGSDGASAAQFLDYDNDGLLDLVVLSQTGNALYRNLGGKWENVTSRALGGGADADALSRAAAYLLASGDTDRDGDTDLLLRLASGKLELARNDGGNRNRSLRVDLAGRVSNRSGIGAKIEARAGSLRQKLETYAASPAPAPSDILFGLGRRAAADAVRVLWPAGIVQAETEIAAARGTPQANAPQVALSLSVVELDRKPSSCPYLYTWNGERFEFVTDFMGGGEMGYWLAPGVRNKPDPDEYVRIGEGQLKERDGFYEIRVTNELEEVLYVDRLQLVAIAHPADVEVHPNEGLIDPPRPPFKLYSARNLRPPVSAVDDGGRDVLSHVSQLDRSYPEGFRLHKIRGYAELHTLTLDLGEAGDKPLLLLTGWTDYAFSSDNVAAHQAGLKMVPPALQVKDAEGRWQTVIEDIGIPVGRPQTLVVDLAGKFLSPAREVRIVTSMRIYWDRVLVGEPDERAAARMKRLDAVKADLRWRGFSAETTPDGREPFGYDYSRVSFTSPWKVMPGRYTREGDVLPLLTRTDDMFIISRPGDEIAVSFDARRLDPLPRGWKRTFLLYSDGFSKEMDVNSASPDQVTPLPFHAMTAYPYPATESYPATRAHRDYLRRYNTRVVRSSVPRIETTFATFFQGRD